MVKCRYCGFEGELSGNECAKCGKTYYKIEKGKPEKRKKKK